MFVSGYLYVVDRRPCTLGGTITEYQVCVLLNLV